MAETSARSDAHVGDQVHVSISCPLFLQATV